jgi:hypothetical protein
MVRWYGILAAATLAAALAAAPAAHAQTGPLEEGPLETGPLQAGPSPTAPQKAKKQRQTTLQKRAKHQAAKQKEEGRQITVHKATPSWLTAGTQVPVGSYNGYVYDTFNQAAPIEGTFTGMRGRERITDQFGNAAPGLTLFKF